MRQWYKWSWEMRLKCDGANPQSVVITKCKGVNESVLVWTKCDICAFKKSTTSAAATKKVKWATMSMGDRAFSIMCNDEQKVIIDPWAPAADCPSASCEGWGIWGRSCLQPWSSPDLFSTISILKLEVQLSMEWAQCPEDRWWCPKASRRNRWTICRPEWGRRGEFEEQVAEAFGIEAKVVESFAKWGILYAGGEARREDGWSALKETEYEKKIYDPLLSECALAGDESLTVVEKEVRTTEQ